MISLNTSYRIQDYFDDFEPLLIEKTNCTRIYKIWIDKNTNTVHYLLFTQLKHSPTTIGIYSSYRDITFQRPIFEKTGRSLKSVMKQVNQMLSQLSLYY